MSRRYLFKLEEDFTFKSQKVCITLNEKLEFRSKKDDELRLEIETDGTIKIKKDFTWDGCSPKFNILDLFWLGTPDGLIDIKTGKPITYDASLVHDALGKFAKEEPERVPFNREERDLIFKEMLEGFALQWLYYRAVRIFGGLYSTFF